MNRYYLVPPDALPTEIDPRPHVGEYHYIDLDSHPGGTNQGHRVLVLLDRSKTPMGPWEELPHLLDAQTTLGAPRHAKHLQLLQHIGVKAEHSGYALAKQLATIHPLFAP